MEPQAELSFTQLFTHVVGDMAKAVAERRGEGRAKRDIRLRAAVRMIMGFMPRDIIEAMLAGRCVMFHELTLDAVTELMRDAGSDKERVLVRRGVVAMEKCFAANLTRLESYQARPSVAPPDAMEAPDSPVVSDIVVPPEGGFPPFREADDPAAELVASGLVSEEAMAALDAGDPAAFARALGIAEPGEAFLRAAAEPGSPFRAGRRKEVDPRPVKVGEEVGGG